jgi:ADP-ribose pyrophosphatase
MEAEQLAQLVREPLVHLRRDEVTLPSGQDITYTLIDTAGFAMFVPLLDDGRVLLERIFRYTLQQTYLECPSGGLDGDSPEACAQRELEEETGWIAGELTSLGTFCTSNGISNERGHLFLGTHLSNTGTMRREPTEQIELELLPFERAVELAFGGGVGDAPSALALILAHRKLRGAP